MNKNLKKLFVLMAVFMFFSVFSVPELTVTVKAVNITDYSYKITPLLPPFNEYFFVETNNPDPESFRFADRSSKYSDESYISSNYDSFYEKPIIYSDIKYSDPETGRVNGGYLFKSLDTDGGEIVLQTRNDAYYSWDVTWSDTSVKFKLPALMDSVDYLISKFAKKDTFFDNMDAVQSGFSSLCLYSGSYVRGELVKTEPYWRISTSPHIDQVFYLHSPYTRKDNKKLFASSIYPYRYDSLGFPSIMASVSKRLNSASIYKWSDYSHAYIDVTYKGETHSYGGQGNGEGQGISEDKIKQYFSFGKNATELTLNGCKKLLDYYSEIEMTDDVPRKDALTWKQVCDTVGDGSWVRLSGCYTYLYKKNSGDNHWNEGIFGDGSEIYWGGDVGYFSDAWIDGRYISSWEYYVPGEKFEDHPTSDIFLKSVDIPQIYYKYGYNQVTGNYDYIVDLIKIEKKDVLFVYNKESNEWRADSDAFSDGCLGIYKIVEMVENGSLARKYLDMVSLTADEVKDLQVDSKTNKTPENFYLFDGSDKPGTNIKDHIHKYNTLSSLTPATLKKNGSSVEECACGATKITKFYSPKTFTLSATSYIYNGKTKNPTVTVKDSEGNTLKKDTDYTVTYEKGRKKPGKYTVKITFKGKYEGVKRLYFTVKPTKIKKFTVSQTTSTITIKWRKLAGVDAYRVYKYNSKTKKYDKVKEVKGTIIKISKLKPGTLYKFKVRGYKKDEEIIGGAYSDEIIVATKPATVKLSKLTAGKKQMTATWKTVSGATGYEVTYSTSKKFTSKTTKKVTIKKSKTKKRTIKKLSKGKKYYVKVRAYKTVDDKKIYGSWSAVKSVKVK